MMTLEELQESVIRLYKEQGYSTNVSTLMLGAMEELGELAQAVLLTECDDYVPSKSKEETELAREIGDIITYLLAICNSMGTSPRFSWLENAPDKLLRYSELIQVLENEIRWCVANPDKGFNTEYNKGFINALIQAKYLVTQFTHLNKKEPGYMGDIGGTPYGPSDRDADEVPGRYYLGECTCGMGAGTIAGEEHAESCPMSDIGPKASL